MPFKYLNFLGQIFFKTSFKLKSNLCILMLIIGLKSRLFEWFSNTALLLDYFRRRSVYLDWRRRSKRRDLRLRNGENWEIYCPHCNRRHFLRHFVCLILALLRNLLIVICTHLNSLQRNSEHFTNFPNFELFTSFDNNSRILNILGILNWRSSLRSLTWRQNCSVIHIVQMEKKIEIVQQ